MANMKVCRYTALPSDHTAAKVGRTKGAEIGRNEVWVYENQCGWFWRSQFRGGGRFADSKTATASAQSVLGEGVTLRVGSG